MQEAGTNNNSDKQQYNIEITPKDIQTARNKKLEEWKKNAIRRTKLSLWQSIIAFFAGDEYEKKCKEQNFEENLQNGVISKPVYSEEELKQTVLSGAYQQKLSNIQKQHKIKNTIIEQEKEERENMDKNKKITQLLKEKEVYIKKFTNSLDINENEMSRLTTKEQQEIAILNDKINKQYQNIEQTLTDYASQNQATANKQEGQKEESEQKNIMDFDTFSNIITLYINDNNNGLKALIDKREKILKEYLDKAKKDNRGLNFEEKQKEKKQEEQNKQEFLNYINNYKNAEMDKQYNTKENTISNEVNINLTSMQKKAIQK